MPRFNKIYGGLNPGVSRLFQTQGDIDPVSTLGALEDVNSLSPVVVIPRESFSRDVFAPNSTVDSSELYEAKMRIQQTIHEWIEYAIKGEFEEDKPNSSKTLSLTNSLKLILIVSSFLLVKF